jgi:hypothetical protein
MKISKINYNFNIKNQYQKSISKINFNININFKINFKIKNKIKNNINFNIKNNTNPIKPNPYFAAFRFSRLRTPLLWRGAGGEDLFILNTPQIPNHSILRTPLLWRGAGGEVKQHLQFQILLPTPNLIN